MESYGVSSIIANGISCAGTEETHGDHHDPKSSSENAAVSSSGTLSPPGSSAIQLVVSDPASPVTETGNGGLELPATGQERRLLRRRRKRVFTETDGSPPFRRYKLAESLDKEVNVEALIAQSVGFPFDSLTEEEIETNVVSTVGGTEQANYIVVRNHILARWRSDVSVWLTRDDALESIRAEHKPLVNAAYDFLLQHGYINFGLAPAIRDERLSFHAAVGDVIVVGAGIAGIVAAKQLVSMGFKVIVLEGRCRPGGRVRTMKLKAGEVEAMADIGGSVVTGMNGNPLGVLVRQLGLPLHKVRDICPLYLPDGKAVDSITDSRVEALFNLLLGRVCKLRESMIEEFRSIDVNLGAALEAFRQANKIAEDRTEGMLFNWHIANLEYANASVLSNLSMAYWDQDDPYEMGGDHCFIPGGTEILVRELLKDLPVFYGKTVQSIRYGADGVVVRANGQEFLGDTVLCTVPLGILKKGLIEFVPELPQRKKEAIQRLGYGLLNKVALLFPRNFWGADVDTFGHLTEQPCARGEFFLFYNYSSVSGGPLLIALVAGDAAVKFETLPPAESVRKVLEILRSIFHPKGIVVPDPLQAICTRWGEDPFSCGSYSYVAVGASGDDYDILSETIGDGRVFFAGEATSRHYPATMHGAFYSGMREAANILKTTKRKSHLTKKPPNDIEEHSDLDTVFRDADMAFGDFSVLFDRRSDDLDSLSLLRFKIYRKEQPDSGSLSLYGLVTKKQAIELSKLQDDLMRADTLFHKFQIRLVGRKGLSADAETLIRHVKDDKIIPLDH